MQTIRRKILAVNKSIPFKIDGELVYRTQIILAVDVEVKARIYKANRIVVLTYLGSLAARGQGAVYYGKKGLSISIKNPSIPDQDLERAQKESIEQAHKNYLLVPTRSKDLIGIVRWFDANSGKGMIEAVNGAKFPLYACDAVGAKTWYADTACIKFEEGQSVVFDLADMGEYITASNVQGGTLDEEKWNSLDQSKLAFKVGDDGKLKSGLFA
jgi:cold shock CspA family protein